MLIETQNRALGHSSNLGDKSDFMSFKIWQLKGKTLSGNNATLPDESCSKKGWMAARRLLGVVWKSHLCVDLLLPLPLVLISLSSSVPGT